MALPSKKIKQIKLPGDVGGNKTYEIIPERLGKNGYEAALPTLTKDTTIATSETAAPSSHHHKVTAAGTVALSSQSSSASGRVSYINAVSFVDGVLTLETKYMAGSFTGTSVNSGDVEN